jgi:hypothetical protein
MGISVKGMVIGYLATLLASFVMGIPLGYLLAATVGPDGARELLAPPSFPITMLAMIAAVLGGYVAARVAGGGELINGALAVLFGSILAALFPGSHDSRDAAIQSVILVAVLPIFGLIGGYIRLRQIADRK